VEWLKVQALSSNTSTSKKKERKKEKKNDGSCEMYECLQSV
jgi:hypothetical protein